jgi:hypothetical protein
MQMEKYPHTYPALICGICHTLALSFKVQAWKNDQLIIKNQ